MIGIIGAMDAEVAGIRQEMTQVSVTRKASMDFVKGYVGTREIVLVKCGVGKVNAAICTQVLIDDYKVDLVVNTGVAGALDARLHIGDIVLATDAIQHDMRAEQLGCKPGEIPYSETSCFIADQEMNTLIRDCCAPVLPEKMVYEGRIVSGDEFVATNERKSMIFDEFHAMCTEMEGAAIAQAASQNHIRFVIMRAISDQADDCAEVDFPTFVEEASKQSVKLILSLLKAMKQ